MTDTPPAGPTVFNDRYELHRKLAQGGMADVYLAKDLLLDRPVAVKVLFPEYASDAAFVERFRREAQRRPTSTTPTSSRVYDWGKQHGTYYIVMEYVEGRPSPRSSAPRARSTPTGPPRSPPTSPPRSAFAHRNGVVHRDVKPGNIIITARVR